MSIAAPATNPSGALELKLPATIGTTNQYLKNSSTAGTLEFGSLTGTHGATDFTISDGNLVVASGHGIDFSATSGSGASELLSDYEHGSWTPTIYSSSGSNFTMGTCEGRYAKVGKLVTLWGVINWTGTAGSGVVNLGGWPYTPHNTSANNAAVYIGSRAGWNYGRLNALMHQSGYINVQYVDASSHNSNNVTIGALASSGHIYYAWSYEAS